LTLRLLCRCSSRGLLTFSLASRGLDARRFFPTRDLLTLRLLGRCTVALPPGVQPPVVRLLLADGGIPGIAAAQLALIDRPVFNVACT
jgi:hypothetical protein